LAIRKTNQRHFPLNYISILFFFLKKVYWWCTFKIFGTFSNLSKYHLYPYWACKKQSYLRSKHVKFILVVFKIRSLNCIWKDVMKSLFFFFGSTGVWTQGLKFARQTLLPPLDHPIRPFFVMDFLR
jgi:hypothetical protein